MGVHTDAMHAEPARLRPNPFALLSETTYRFALLIVAIVGSSFYLLAPWAIDLLPDQRAGYNAIHLCAPVPGRAGVPGGIDFSAIDRMSSCLDALPSLLGLGLAVTGLTAGIVLVGVAMYFRTPARLIRRRRLARLPLDAMPVLSAALAELRAVAGVGAVTFLVDPLERRQTGLAFGRAGRWYVVLSRGLLPAVTSDPALFRAVVLHELAHIVNHDVDRTFLTVALWRSFFALVVVPSALSVVAQLILAGFFVLPKGLVLDVAGSLQVGWHLVVLTLLVLLIRNHILRSRELSADVRAAQWGSADRLRVLFTEPTGQPAPADRTGLAAVARRLLGLAAGALRTHPGRSARAKALDDPAVLMEVGPWDGLVLGITATLATASLNLPTGWLLGPRSGQWLDLVTSWSLATLLGFACCLLVFRAVLASRVTGRAPNLGRFAIALGVGLPAGTVLGVSSATLPPGDVAGPLAPGPLTLLLWITLSVCLAVVFVQWLRVMAAAWMPVVLRAASPTVALVLGGAVVAATLQFWLSPLLLFPAVVAFSQALLPGQPEIVPIAFVLASVVLLGGLGLLAFLTAQWAIPFAAVLFTRGDAGVAPSWTSLDAAPAVRLLARPALRPLTAAKAGLAIGAGATVVLVALDGVALALSPANWLSDVCTGAAMVVAIPAILTAAARGSWTAADARPLHGLLAAYVAGAVTMVPGFGALAGACDLRGSCATVSGDTRLATSRAPGSSLATSPRSASMCNHGTKHGALPHGDAQLLNISEPGVPVAPGRGTSEAGRAPGAWRRSR